MDELVSVIIPVYNKEKYIEACLCSVINQEYTNLQIIVINDGSTDHSLDVIEQLAIKEKRIEIINQENLGRGKARNKGIDLAKGNFIAMVDADDTVDARYIFEMLSVIKDKNADCAVCGMNIIGTKTRRVCLNNQEEMATNMNFMYRYIANNGHGLGTSSCNKLFRTSIIRENNIRYKNIEIGEDYLFCLEYAWASRLWCSCNKALYNYVQNAASTMHEFSEEQNTKIYSIYDELVAFSKNHNLYEQLQGALSTSYIKFIFKEALTISSEKDGISRINQYKKLLNDDAKRNIVLDANLEIMSNKYKPFYYLYVWKRWILLDIFMHLYKLYIGGTI